jgi:hypothetical protein
MERKAFLITRLFLATIVVLSLYINIGCGGATSGGEGNTGSLDTSDRDAWLKEYWSRIWEPSDQAKAIIQNPNPSDYIRYPSSTVFLASDPSGWEPLANELYSKFNSDDLVGALDILYRDILGTDLYKKNQWVFYIQTGSLRFLFYDPIKVFQIYRDADRSGWSDDEKAAADLMVALTYEFGDVGDLLPQELYTDQYGPLEFQMEVQVMARDLYGEIAENYRNSHIAVLAQIRLALWYLLRQHITELVTGREASSKIHEIEEEVADNHPDSVYLARIVSILANAYEQEGNIIAAIDKYRITLELPDFIIGHDGTTAHESAKGRIDLLQNQSGQ